jgi:hypothetical protein
VLLVFFATVAQRAAETIEAENHSRTGSSITNFPVDSCQLVSSAAICSSTAVKICGQKAIPALPKLVPSLLDILAAIVCKPTQSPTQEKCTEEHIDWNQARLTQLSILRALRTVISTLPLLLKQHLDQLLGTILLVPASPFYDVGNFDSTLISDYKKLTKTVSSCVPARQLIPSAAVIVSSVSANTSIVSLLSILTDSVKSSKSAEVSSQTQPILEVVFYAVEHGSVVDSDEILSASNDLVVSLVMKQSEVQFRTLFQKLCVWRSEHKHMYAFWNLCSSLSKNLKSIFLPCLTAIFEDVIEELVSFVTLFQYERPAAFLTSLFPNY